MYELKEIDAKTQQDFFDNYSGEKSFLQTPAYAQFRTEVGEPTKFYGIYKSDELIGITLIQKIPAKKSSFLHIPHGPLLKNEDALEDFLKAYIELGKKEGVDFVRISPLLPADKKTMFQKIGFKDAAVHLQNPEKTWILNLEASEEELIKNMRKNTRYEVRRIEKMGVETKMGNSAEDLEIFWNLHKITVERQGFVPFPKSNTKKEMRIFGNNCQIFSSKYENEYLSSSIILFDNHAGYYHQGASERSKAPVAYASLWSAILEAKKRGCTEFNFWGVCGEDEKDHPWYGLSRFKRGFGGEERNFLHAQDYPITLKYHLGRAVEKYRKWKRNY